MDLNPRLRTIFILHCLMTPGLVFVCSWNVITVPCPPPPPPPPPLPGHYIPRSLILEGTRLPLPTLPTPLDRAQEGGQKSSGLKGGRG